MLVNCMLNELKIYMTPANASLLLAELFLKIAEEIINLPFMFMAAPPFIPVATLFKN